jgi:hypothetical protein
MSLLERELHPGLLRWEWVAVCLLAGLAFVSIPLSLGEIGISWDALNHHIYLGWTADHPRFDLDFVAAGYQSFQFPYLYWPVYQLATSGWSGASAGAVLAILHLIAVPPVWMLARICMPGRTTFDASMRMLSVVLAFITGVVLSLFDSTSNDLMAAAPLLWAVALAMEPLNKTRSAWLTSRRAVVLSGFCAGVAVACKLSNGPLAIVLPALWLMWGATTQRRLLHVLLGSFATLAAFVAAYGYWGMLLWNHFGNPIYPFFDGWFGPVRVLLGWTP